MSDLGRRVVGVLQIAGGATGVLGVWHTLFSDSGGLGPLYAEVLLCIVSGFSIVAGVLVLEKQPRGLFLSKSVQLVAVPILFTPIFSYQLLSGFTVRVVLGSASGFQYFWANGLTMQLFLEHEVSAGLNVFALGLFLYLRRCSFNEQASVDVLAFD